jgi:hypothetical protein
VKLDQEQSCADVYHHDGIRVCEFLQGSRKGQRWALHEATGIDAYGETIPSAIMALRVKMRGFGIVDMRKGKEGRKHG